MKGVVMFFVFALLSLLLTATAHANVGAAGFMSISNMPAQAALQTTGLAMVIIILVEMLIFRRRQNASYWESFKLLTLANVASLVAGYVILAILIFPYADLVGLILIPWVLSRLVAKISQESGGEAWSRSASKYLPFLVLVALTVSARSASSSVGAYLFYAKSLPWFFLGGYIVILCLFGIISSAIIEAWVIVKMVANKKGVLMTCLLMNIVSYLVLGVKFLPPMLNTRHDLVQGRAPLGGTPASQSPQDIVQQGWILETQGRWDEAFALYNKAIEMDPNCAVAYKHRGTVYTRKGAFEKAIPEFQKAAELDPTHASTYYNLGNLYLDMRDYDHAVESFSKAIELSPGYAAAIQNRGAAYASKNDLAKAVEDYERYLTIMPNDKNTHLARGAASELMRDFDKALESYTNAIVLAPRDKTVYSARARVYLFRKNFDQAIADISKVIELDPEDLAAREGRVAIYALAERYDEALSELNTLIDRDPRNPDYYSRRGLIHQQKGRGDMALADINTAMKFDGDNEIYYTQRAGVYLVTGEFEKSWGDVAKIRELGGRVPDPFIFELETKSGRQDPDVQLQTPGDYYDLYIKYFVLGYIKRSYEVAQKALEVFPDDKDMLQVKAALDKQIQEDYKGEIPEKIKIQGGEFVLSMLDGARRQTRMSEDKGTAELGPDGQSDRIRLPFGTLTLTGPQGWEKKANFKNPNGSQMLILYTKTPGAAFPCVAVSTDKLLPGVTSAVEFSGKMRERMLRSDPPPEITQPREQTINGHTVSYMEIAVKGTHDIQYRFAWYQFLFRDLIVTIQYHGSEYHLKEWAPEFRQVVESLTFEESSL